VKGRSAPWTESDLALAADLRRAIETETAHRTKAELALKSNSLEITLRHMNQGIMMIDADHRVQVCNDGALRSLGLAKSLMNSRPRLEEIVEDLARERRSGGEALLQDLRDFLPEVRLADEPRITERTGPDGVVYEVRSMPMPGGGVVSTYTDVTLRKETEAKLRVARDQAQAATHAKSEFLATMSHEIRSPLSGLVGLIELLRETKLEPEQLQMANMAHDSALALLAVLNDVLTFSKIEAKGLSIMPEAVRLRDLVAAVVEPHRLEAARKSVVLTWSADPALPDCVSVDPLRLRQILNNLLSNAVKFTLSGDIELRVELAGDGSGAQMTFSARDSGIGMTEAVLGRLFEPFVQADASTTRDFGGTGLGLSISSRLARMLGGTLTASSRHGVGSTFVLTLPLLAAETPDASDAANAAPAPAIAGRGARVLVVDDDPSIRWLTKRQLELLGLTAVAAENGESALELLRAERFDLVLTDCHMPRMDGIALARAIRGEPDPRLRGIPIVGLTADVTETQRDRALAAGMAEVGMKPLSRAQLSQLLARHLPSGAGKNPEEAHAPAPAPARPSVAFDDETYKDLFEGDDLEGKAWLDEYFAMADSLVVELQRFVGVAAEADLPRLEIAEAAHALAGASLSVGATRVGEEARALQYAAAGDAAARLIDRQETLRKELDAAKTAVSEFLAGSRAAA
jgi:signal transduction histidine kinase/CheY-like chemotaxis protein/HPt (histidine-containing phosphotransfer) domain-containing protein